MSLISRVLYRVSIMPRRTSRLVKYCILLMFAVSCVIIITQNNSSNNTPELNAKMRTNHKSAIDINNNDRREIDKSTKIDWHDYEMMKADKARIGPGEQGAAFRIPTDPETKSQSEQLYRVNGFNALTSDFVALNRSVKDIRHKDCRRQKYLAHLPTVSVILPVYNEHWSTLLRSVWSIINRSPPELLKEVILADDHSTKEFLGEQLDQYIAQHWPNALVKVVRAPQRDGLIRARLIGAKMAAGDVLLFLDSHSECNYNWLPPLLEPIALDRRTAVCPFVDVIDFETFEYRAQDEGGGLRIWQCGGRLVDAPCSRVGHIYRRYSPFPSSGKGDYLTRNHKRVAEVWMDEYKEYIYKRRPHYNDVDVGDITAQQALRHKLQCKSFKWFMENVAFDLTKKYPPFEPDPGAEGEIRNNAAVGYCVDSRFKGQEQAVELHRCVSEDPGGGGEQNFELTFRNDIRPKKRTNCLDVPHSEKRAPVILYPCHGGGGNQEWRYDIDTQQLVHPTSGTCLDCDPDAHELFVMPCDSDKQSQKWTFATVRREVLNRQQENIRRR